MATTDPDLRAKDLLRHGDVARRDPCGMDTVRYLFLRAARRPAGNSAKLWKKVGAEDPFALSPEDAKPEHRAVYASGRFVRIDQHEKAQGKSPQDKIREKARNEAPPPRPQPQAQPKPAEAQRPQPPKQPEAPRAPVHTPAPGQRPAPNPLRQPATRAQPSGPTAGEVDRTPPIVRPSQPGISPAGRFRSQPSSQPGPSRAPQARKPGAAAAGRQGEIGPRPTPKSTGPVDRTPPIVRPGEGPPKAAAPFTSGVDALPRPKPKAPPAPSPTPAPAPPPAERSAAPPTPRPAPPQPASKPPAPVAQKPAPPPTPAPAAPKPPPAAPPAAASEPTAVTPPGQVLNQMSGPQVVPKRRPTQAAPPEPAPEPAKPAAAPKPGAPPTGGGGGLDDLFGGGGAQEGRVRMSRPKK